MMVGDDEGSLFEPVAARRRRSKMRKKGRRRSSAAGESPLIMAEGGTLVDDLQALPPVGAELGRGSDDEDDDEPGSRRRDPSGEQSFWAETLIESPRYAEKENAKLLEDTLSSLLATTEAEVPLVGKDDVDPGELRLGDALHALPQEKSDVRMKGGEPNDDARHRRVSSATGLRESTRPRRPQQLNQVAPQQSILSATTGEPLQRAAVVSRRPPSLTDSRSSPPTASACTAVEMGRASPRSARPPQAAVIPPFRACPLNQRNIAPVGALPKIGRSNPAKYALAIGLPIPAALTWSFPFWRKNKKQEEAAHVCWRGAPHCMICCPLRTAVPLWKNSSSSSQNLSARQSAAASPRTAARIASGAEESERPSGGSSRMRNSEWKALASLASDLRRLEARLQDSSREAQNSGGIGMRGNFREEAGLVKKSVLQVEELLRRPSNVRRSSRDVEEGLGGARLRITGGGKALDLLKVRNPRMGRRRGTGSGHWRRQRDSASDAVVVEESASGQAGDIMGEEFAGAAADGSLAAGEEAADGGGGDEVLMVMEDADSYCSEGDAASDCQQPLGLLAEGAGAPAPENSDIEELKIQMRSLERKLEQREYDLQKMSESALKLSDTEFLLKCSTGLRCRFCGDIIPVPYSQGLSQTRDLEAHLAACTLGVVAGAALSSRSIANDDNSVVEEEEEGVRCEEFEGGGAGWGMDAESIAAAADAAAARRARVSRKQKPVPPEVSLREKLRLSMKEEEYIADRMVVDVPEIAEHQDGYKQYVVTMKHGSHEWRVARRFNEILDLHKNLSAVLPPSTFPVNGIPQKVYDPPERKARLKVYLATVVRTRKARLTMALRQFLDLDENLC